MRVTEKVIKIILYHAGAKREEITEEVLIEDELGVTGDDAWELMEDIHKEFGVNYDQFDFSLHFGPEAGYSVAEEYGYYPVSVRHLIEVVNEKQWKLPERNEEHYLLSKERRHKERVKWLLITIGITILLLIFALSEKTANC
ncbi:MAG: DUF1493 family protein [Candidatus Thiodiazotropha sp. (ex Lucinoma borealis)]|nr:DUF1493 family protein [Candidatus Thiodiazotropha sp. (ex Lucinoma borealis)]